MSKQVEKARGDRKAFCDYLRAGREARELSLDEIARITRIPERSLAHLESGDFESLPADVFVRGFLRSYAQVVGLDPDDALRRYADCGLAPSPVSQHGARASTSSGAGLARGSRRRKPAALAEPPPAADPEPAAVADEAPHVAAAPAADEVLAAAPVADEVPAVDAAPAPAASTSDAGESRKRKRRRRKKKNKKPAAAAEAAAAEPAPVAEVAAAEPVAEVAAAEPAPVAEVAAAAPAPAPVAEVAAAAEPAPATVTVVPPRPVLVIDDDDPTEAEQAQAMRIHSEADERELAKRSFLPSALLESDEGSRRGALTLAVIILVIVATLTMSYLLRHPSSSGSGVTELDTHGTTRA